MLKHISKLMKEIESVLNQKPIVIIGIDGRSGSGKTMLSKMIQQVCEDSFIFHMDDYYKPIHKREEHWQVTPLAHMDIERMKKEVIIPAFQSKNLIYRSYDEKEDTYVDTYKVIPQHVYIVEGTYALCPELQPYYDITIYLTCSPEVQEKRLKKARPNDFYAYFNLMIPLEEEYFYQYRISKVAQYYFDTTDLK